MKIVIIASVPESIISFRGHLIKSFIDNLDEVHIIAPFSKNDKKVVNELIEMGALTHSIKLQRAVVNVFSDLLYLKNLFFIIASVKPDIVFSYTIKPVIYGSIVAGLLRVKNIYAMITGLGSNFIESNKATNILLFLYRVAMKFNKIVFFQNKDDQEFFLQNKILLNKNKSKIINGSGVDLNHYNFSDIPKSHSILLIGRLIKNKGIYEYVEAAKLIKAKYPEICFKLVGNLEENFNSIDKKDLDDWISNQYIEFVGSIEDVREEIKKCSIYVLPSYREGTPRSVLEAMSMGRPIITSDAPGCRETVIDGYNGFLVRPGSSKDIVNAILKFIINPNLAKEMGNRSFKIAKEKYDVKSVNAIILTNMNIPS